MEDAKETETAKGKETEKEDVIMEDKENQAAEAAEPEPHSKELEIGDKLPAGWTFPNEKDVEVTIAELTAEKGLVIFIVPKADTREQLFSAFLAFHFDLPFLFSRMQYPGVCFP